MNCENARKSLPLMLYGELSFDDEEALETHLEKCAGCRAEMATLRGIERVLDTRELDVSPFLLRECRERLKRSLEQEQAHTGLAARVKIALSHIFSGVPWAPRMARPVGAAALVALGFFGSRIVSNTPIAGFQNASVLDPAARVRYVEPAPGGKVQLVVDETRQRVISGSLEDEQVRRLLLSAAKDSSDPGLRVESVEILKQDCDSNDVRGVLMAALQHDPNPGVRLKALEGLKPYASQPEVRKALAQALLSDDNPGIRTQAIDLLIQNAKEQPLIGVLQELMRKESNSYVRLQCQKALREMKASAETY
jgi:hypothetical protein